MKLGCLAIMLLTLGCSNNPKSQSRNQLNEAFHLAKKKLNTAFNLVNNPQLKKISGGDKKSDKAVYALEALQSKDLETKIFANLDEGAKILEKALASISSLPKNEQPSQSASQCYILLAKIKAYKSEYCYNVAKHYIVQQGKLKDQFSKLLTGLYKIKHIEFSFERAIRNYNQKKLDADELKEKFDNDQQAVSDAKEKVEEVRTKIANLVSQEKSLLENQASNAMKAEELSKVSGKADESRKAMQASVKAGKAAVLVRSKIRDIQATEKDASIKSLEIANSSLEASRKSYKYATKLLEAAKEYVRLEKRRIENVNIEKKALYNGEKADDDNNNEVASFAGIKNIVNAYGKNTKIIADKLLQAKKIIAEAITSADKAVSIFKGKTSQSMLLTSQSDIYFLAAKIDFDTYRASAMLANFNKNYINATITKQLDSEAEQARVLNDEVKPISVPATLSSDKRNDEFKAGLNYANKALEFATSSTAADSLSWPAKVKEASMNFMLYNTLKVINVDGKLTIEKEYTTALNSSKSNAIRLIGEAKAEAGDDNRFAEAIDLYNQINASK